MCPRCGSKEVITWDDEIHTEPDCEISDGGYEDEDD